MNIEVTTTLGEIKKLGVKRISAWSNTHRALVSRVERVLGLDGYTQLYITDAAYADEQGKVFKAIYAVKPVKVLGYYAVDDDCKAICVQREYVPDRTN